MNVIKFKAYSVEFELELDDTVAKDVAALFSFNLEDSDGRVRLTVERSREYE